MCHDYIQQDIKKLVKSCGSRNPFEICELIGLKVNFADLGNLKGTYSIYKRNRFTIINNSLNEYMQKLVCAHELGHDRLHQHLVKSKSFQEFMLYDMKSRPEFEANVFASELLILDEDILDLAQNGYDAEQIAQKLYTDINLISLKMSSMITRGHNLKPLNIYSSDFLQGNAFI